jgi:hypothetical protein
MNTLSSSSMRSIRLALCPVLLAAAAEAGAACATTDVDGNWEIFYGPTQAGAAQCQVKASKGKNLSGQCRVKQVLGKFSDWQDITKGRLKVDKKCAMIGQFVIPTGAEFILNGNETKAVISAARMHKDKNAFDGILEVTNENSGLSITRLTGVKR